MISVTPAKSAPPATIYHWLRLFATYAAVYTERYLAQGPAMWSYAIGIMDLHRQYAGTGWRTYDEKFRRVKAHCPTLPWHVVNWDMAMSAIHTTMPPQPSTSSKPGNRQPFRSHSGSHSGARTGYNRPRMEQHGQPATKGVCFRFNQQGACDFVGCRYKHVCSSCGKGHSKQTCRVGTNPSTRPSNFTNTSKKPGPV